MSNALVNLDCRRTRGQGEVEAVHRSRVVHAGERPERGLRFAGAVSDSMMMRCWSRCIPRSLLYRVWENRLRLKFREFGHILEAVFLADMSNPVASIASSASFFAALM